MDLFLNHLQSGHSLSEQDMISAMKEIMSGKVSEEEIIRFLTLLRDKVETKDEILGAVRVMREHAVKVPLSTDNLVDTCGTGGDNKGTFNISTAAGFVLAGDGVRVAKHGNRAVSSQSGSADVLEKLGVRIDLSPLQVSQCIQATGFGFFFARNFHPAMKEVASARAKIGTRTIFNLLGPLTNPAQPLFQVIGVYDPKKMILMAEVLKELGSRHVLLVHGEDGLDEITLTGKTFVVELKEGKITEWEIDPRDFGLELCSPEDLKGKDANDNATLMKGILEGYDCPLRNAILLNSAGGFIACGRAVNFEEGLMKGDHSLDQGRAYEVLKGLVKVSTG